LLFPIKELETTIKFNLTYPNSYFVTGLETKAFHDLTRVELLPGFKFTRKMVKIMEFTGKICKAGKR